MNRVDRFHKFIELTAPFVQRKLYVINRSIPQYTLYPDGRMTVVHPSWVQEILDECDSEIAKIAKTFKEAASPDNGSATKMT